MLDVYARQYVPQWQRSINSSPAQSVSTRLSLAVDYGLHRSAFLTLISPDRPTLTPLDLFRTPQRASLDPEGYFRYFEDGLVLENQALQKELGQYDMFNVSMQVVSGSENGFICELVVPGLQEYTPPVFVGDNVSLRQVWADQPHPMHGVQYDAVVTAVQRARESLRLCVSGLQPVTLRFNVMFQLQATRIEPMRLAVLLLSSKLAIVTPTMVANNWSLHGANDEGQKENLATRSWTQAMLFPEVGDGALQTTLNKISAERQWYDSALNYEQKRAIDSICQQNYGRLPFLISGPPGTGKTKTLVETALQLLLDGTRSLLICAPSDQAADTLLQRLRLHVAQSDMLRLLSPARSFAEVPGDVLPYCFVDNNTFSLPSTGQLMQYAIVITSCRDAIMLVHAGVTNQDLVKLEHGVASTLHPSESRKPYNLHWRALLLDEAAQASEPEAAIPLAVIIPPAEQDLYCAPPCLVMAGDQQQLGPRTASGIPEVETSLFARLFDRYVYASHPLARSRLTGRASRSMLTKDLLPMTRPAFTTLVRNYRSHPAILAIPSKLFYHDTLIPEATSFTGLLPWSGWCGRGWPVLFSANDGHDDVDSDGGGWYNVSEAETACDYAASLSQSGLIDQRDICIISPFRAQVQRLRRFARSVKYNLWEVNIGPLEAFQGLESRAVILCTTRARGRFLDEDKARGWGIVHDSRKFNVAVTRAKEGLIVIGSEEVLSTNSNWKSFIGFCDRHGLRDGPLSANVAHPPEGAVSVLETALLMAEAGPQAGKYVGLSLAADLDEEMMLSGVAAELQLDNDNEDEDDYTGRDKGDEG